MGKKAFLRLIDGSVTISPPVSVGPLSWQTPILIGTLLTLQYHQCSPQYHQCSPQYHQYKGRATPKRRSLRSLCGTFTDTILEAGASALKPLPLPQKQQGCLRLRVLSKWNWLPARLNKVPGGKTTPHSIYNGLILTPYCDFGGVPRSPSVDKS